MTLLARLRRHVRSAWELRSCVCGSMYDPTDPAEAAQHRTCTA